MTPLGLRSLVYVAGLALVLGACDAAPRGGSPAPSASPQPARLPTAGRLLFSDGTDLYASGPAGSDRTRITRDGADGFYAGGRWSPDGKRVAAERSIPTENGPQLFLVDVASGQGERLSPAGTWLDGFAWSPDGAHIVYASLTSGGTPAPGRTPHPEKGQGHRHHLAPRTPHPPR